ncbi:hypothetical protein, partial [Schleiferia thermophila]
MKNIYFHQVLIVHQENICVQITIFQEYIEVKVFPKYYCKTQWNLLKKDHHEEFLMADLVHLFDFQKCKHTFPELSYLFLNFPILNCT